MPPIKIRNVPVPPQPPQSVPVPPRASGRKPEQDSQKPILIAAAVVVAIAVLALLLLAVMGCPPKGSGGDGNGGTAPTAGDGGNGTGDGTEWEALATEATDTTETAVEIIDVDYGEGMMLRRGGKTSLAIFGGKGSGNRFAFIFDKSASMRGNPFQQSKKQLVAALKSLNPQNEFSIVFFDSNPEMYLSGMQKASQHNINNAVHYVENVSLGSGTEHIPALQMGIKLQPDCIFFLTDGQFSGDEKQQLADIKQHAKGIQINVIELGTDPQAPTDNFLKQLAKQNNGDYVYVYTTARQ